MDLLVPCIEEGRSELRNAGRVNCKTHWPFSGCRAPYLLNDFKRLRVTAPFWCAAACLVECTFSCCKKHKLKYICS